MVYTVKINNNHPAKSPHLSMLTEKNHYSAVMKKNKKQKLHPQEVNIQNLN